MTYPKSAEDDPPLHPAYLWTLWAAWLMNAAMVLLPEIFFDALHYHLALPQQWLLAHSITRNPYLLFADFPPGMEVLYGWALAMGGVGATKWLHLAFGTAVIIQIIQLGRRLGNRSAGIIAAATFAAAPVVGANLISCHVDLPMTLFLLCGLETLITEDLSLRQRGAWGGLLLGFAMWIKYTAWMFSGIILCWWVLHLLLVERRGWNTSLKYGWVGGCLVLTIASPWVVRNLYLHGLPWYPYGASLGENFSILLREQQGGGGGSILSSFMSPFASSNMGWQWLIGLPLVTYMAIRSIWNLPPTKSYKYIVSIGLLTFALFIISISLTRVTRFYLPIFALLSLLIGFSLVQAKYQKQALCSWLFVLWIPIAWLGLHYLKILNPWPYLIGNTPIQAYLSHPHGGYPNPPFPAIDFINAHTSKHAKIMFIGELRPFYCDRQVLYSSAYQTPPFIHGLDLSQTGKNFRQILDIQGVTHLLVNWPELDRLNKAYRLFWLDGRKQALYNSFIQTHTIKIFDDRQRGLLVYELKRGRGIRGLPAHGH